MVKWDEKEPTVEYRGDGSFSLYFNDVEVIVDREIDGEIEVRIWQNGVEEDVPLAVMRAEIGV
jgi:hypothetical protein